VITACDGLDGIKKAAENRPELIFLDLIMPKVNGLKVLEVKKVLSEIRSIPVIVISANTARSNVVSAMELGADRIISKPIENELVKKYVNELLGGENFQKTQDMEILSDNESKEIKNQLVTFFLNSFPMKQKIILDAIKNKNSDKLKETIHELRGVGGTIGYPELTALSKEVEEKDLDTPTDWIFAELKSNQIFKLINQIKSELKNN
jgi:CheY-like chemotaxis protein/HPt (histidine-containing phosphotransfer) domain-containing protein